VEQMQANKVRSRMCKHQNYSRHQADGCIEFELSFHPLAIIIGFSITSIGSRHSVSPDILKPVVDWGSVSLSGPRQKRSIHVEQDLIAPLCRSSSFKKKRSIL